ncbi:MAG: class IV adenylate cyclase [Anaerolineales bacterium]|jgi:predicted adenylyl cyclase CyaB|nr:class IV adenylate cyclase [Anaerolineales bacterium]
MPRNVEIKARVTDLASIEVQASMLAQPGPRLIIQEDIFFFVPQGRLKLRKFDAAHGELIYYEREDTLEPKESFYLRSATADPDGLTETLKAALGLRGVVRKQRTLYLVGQTRVHLDRVEGLGDFVELEVVLGEGQSVEDGAQVAQALMQALGIRADGLITGAYIDLLEAQERAKTADG